MPVGPVPPGGGPPKPKSKGKRPGPAKPNVCPKVDPIDVFKAVLESDAGAEAQEQDPYEGFAEHIRRMSKPELSRLERKIRRVRRQMLKNMAKADKEEVCDYLSSTIHERIQASAEVESQVSLEIKAVLETLPLQNLRYRRNGRPDDVLIDDKWVSIRALVRKYFSKQVELVRELIQEGSLIRQHRRHGARGYVQRCIATYLKQAPEHYCSELQ